MLKRVQTAHLITCEAYVCVCGWLGGGGGGVNAANIAPRNTCLRTIVTYHDLVPGGSNHRSILKCPIGKNVLISRRSKKSLNQSKRLVNYICQEIIWLNRPRLGHETLDR